MKSLVLRTALLEQLLNSNPYHFERIVIDVQNFVGALAGNQAHKGIFITTIGYNDNAIEYAKTVPQKVILIDGQRLAELMIEHNVGVSTENTIAIKRIDSDYFEDS